MCTELSLALLILWFGETVGEPQTIKVAELGIVNSMQSANGLHTVLRLPHWIKMWT
jgi:hypothetical protein